MRYKLKSTNDLLSRLLRFQHRTNEGSETPRGDYRKMLRERIYKEMPDMVQKGGTGYIFSKSKEC